MKTFIFHTDPGHGWLEVTQLDLDDLLLTYIDFSEYSFTDGATRLFLEEDCDAGIFLEAYKAKHGADSFRFDERNVNQSHKIRNYTRLPATYTEDLTDVGVQYVIPGAERVQDHPTSPAQKELW